MRIKACEDLSFCNHSFCVISEHFSGNRAVHDGGDFLNDCMEVLSFLGDQGRVRRYAGNESHVIGFANGFDISGINKKFHFFLLLSL